MVDNGLGVPYIANLLYKATSKPQSLYHFSLCNLMSAEPSARRQGFAYEALLLMMCYGKELPLIQVGYEKYTNCHVHKFNQ